MKKSKCAYCGDKGWLVRTWLRYGWRVGGLSSMFVDGGPVYRCTYCDRPEHGLPMPEEMFKPKEDSEK